MNKKQRLFPLFLLISPYLLMYGQSSDSLKLLIAATYTNITSYQDTGYFRTFLTSRQTATEREGTGSFQITFDRPTRDFSFHSELAELFPRNLTVLKETELFKLPQEDTYVFRQTGNGRSIFLDTVSLNLGIAMALGSGQRFLHFVAQLLMNNQIEGRDSFTDDAFVQIEDGLTAKGEACYKFRRRYQVSRTEEELKETQGNVDTALFSRAKTITTETVYWFEKNSLLLLRQEYSSTSEIWTIGIDVRHGPVVSY